EVAGRARGDPAPERGELERLGEVTQRQAMLAQPTLQDRTTSATLDAGRARDRVDLEDAVQRAQIERDRAVVGGPNIRAHTPDDGGAAAVGYGGHALLRAPLEHALDLRLLPRAGDEVRRVVEAPAKASDHVRVGPAPRVGCARVGVARAN